MWEAGSFDVMLASFDGAKHLANQYGSKRCGSFKVPGGKERGSRFTKEKISTLPTEEPAPAEEERRTPETPSYLEARPARGGWNPAASLERREYSFFYSLRLRGHTGLPAGG